MTDGLAAERWINEGGQLAPEPSSNGSYVPFTAGLRGDAPDSSSPAEVSQGSRRCSPCARWPAIESTSRSSRPSCDAVAEAIAASVGVDLEPQPFRPVLRGVLQTGAAPRYLCADISGCAGDDSTCSSEPLWWPPNKLSARYLAPYLSRQTGEAADVMRPTPMRLPSTAEHPLGRSAS